MTSSIPVPSFATPPISSGRSSVRWRRATHPAAWGEGDASDPGPRRAGVGWPRVVGQPRSVIFEWDGVSPGFASPLPTSFEVALVLLAGLSLLLLAGRIAGGRFTRRGRLSVGLVLRLRAVSHVLTRRRPSLERVLILGTSPLARKLIEEIEAQPHRRYTVVGVVDDGTGLRE